MNRQKNSLFSLKMKPWKTSVLLFYALESTLSALGLHPLSALDNVLQE